MLPVLLGRLGKIPDPRNPQKLKDGSLPSVWEEYHSLRHEQEENRWQQDWGERRQLFQWVNATRYEYGSNVKKSSDVHVVVCREGWEALDPDTLLDVRRAGGDRLYPQCPHRPVAGSRQDQATPRPTLSITLGLTPPHRRLLPLAEQVVQDHCLASGKHPI